MLIVFDFIVKIKERIARMISVIILKLNYNA